MSALTVAEACHLSRRTGFCAQPKIVEALISFDSREDAIDALLTQSSSLIDLPEWHDTTPFGKTAAPEQKQRNKQLRRQMSAELKYWWFQQMVSNTSSVQEKMTLFWANHFTSSLKKVKWPPALLAQNLLLREHALGNFGDLLNGILRDPAMLLYLDNANSKKGAPNENLARELMELFTLGEGNYSETDVKELSRALTGASVNRRTGQYSFRRRAHDSGEKTILGNTGNFTPSDVAALLLEQPTLPHFICEKVWRFIVGTSIDALMLDELATHFSQSNFNIADMVKRILVHPDFWSSQGLIIKSPMELIVGSTQLFELPLAPIRQFISTSRALGQDLFDPPHVKGWAEGRAWYNTSTLATREKVASFVARRATRIPSETEALAITAVATLPVPSHRSFVQHLVHDPAYHVA